MSDERNSATPVHYTVPDGIQSRELVDQASCYLTSARALMDLLLEDSDAATNELFGVYHLLRLAEVTIEAGQVSMAKEGK